MNARQRVRSLAIPADERGFRLRVAVVMALVSLASAYVTYVATELGSSAAALNGAASQQSAQEQQSEQQIDAWVDQDLALTARLDEPLQTYRQSQQQAQALRASDPARAAQLDLQAQASWDELRQLYAFLHLPGYLDLSGQSATYDADGARTWARVTDWRLFGGSSQLTRDQAAATGTTASQAVLIVVVLVAALFLLTLAHVAGPRRGLPLAIAGGSAALVGVLAFAFIDFAAALPVLVVAAGLLAVVLALAILGHERRLLTGLEQSRVVAELVGVPTRPGMTAASDPDAAPSTRYTRFAAITIALVTLLGALVGYLQVGAASGAETASWQGRDLGVRAIGALRASEDSLSVNVQAYELGVVQRGHAWAASQQAAYDDSIGDGTAAGALRQAAANWATLADQTMGRSGLVDTLGASGVAANGALAQLRAEVWGPAARLAGEQSAANARAQAWGAQASLYISVLAWLAVAAYLLGLSLVFREPSVRLLLASVATLLILAGGARSAATALQSDVLPDATAEQAAGAYADGYVALQQADYATAEADLGQAIELWPGFGLAHRDRAEAIYSQGTVQGVGLRSVFTVDAIDRALADLDAASQHGVSTAGVLLNEGALLFHRAVLLQSAPLMQQSADLSRQGITAGQAFTAAYGVPHIDEVIAESNLALALLGNGQQAAAQSAYGQLVIDTRRLPAAMQRFVVAAALTDLEILADAPVPVSGAVLSAMKALIVGGVYGGAAGSPASLSGARAELFPSTFQWRATIAGFEPASDTLVAEWSVFDAATGRWSVLPLISGPLTLGQTSAAGEMGRDAGADAYFGRSSNELLDTPPRCMAPGRYRVELYLNGTLTSSAEADWTGGEYTPSLARDVGVALCQPADWQPAGVEAGYSTGIASSDGSRGLVVYRLHQPLNADGSDARPTTLARLLATHAASLPAGMDAGQPLDANQQPTVFGTHGGAWRLHTYQGGAVKTVASYATGSPGSVIVVCLYGPPDWIDSADANALLVSLSEYGG